MTLLKKELVPLIIVHYVIKNDIARMIMWSLYASPLCSRASKPRTTSPWMPWFQTVHRGYIRSCFIAFCYELNIWGSPALIVTPVVLWQSEYRSFKVAGKKMTNLKASRKIITIKTKTAPKLFHGWALLSSSRKQLGLSLPQYSRQCFQ